MTEPPEQHHEDPELLFRPLSDAEIAKRRRMMDQRAAEPDPTDLMFLSIMMHSGPLV